MALTYDIEKDAFYQKGVKKGRKVGIEEGEKKGILQAALNMKKAGFSTEDIMKATNLNKEQVEQL
ncbi:hypothetical protein [uncultured Microscilla sp.]|uniref:hypothetical protein n=1 Tax=uncultured Microscilla sp. TaxID=432653 RepID=UPI0026102706|nr:hypothetical protein [uncultured Microscilla sp.]